MLLALVLTLGAIILIGYYPLQLHLDSIQLDQPVVVFRGSFWREGLALLQLTGLILFALVLLWTPVPGWPGRLILLLAMLLLLRVILLRSWLHLSYWRHERQATLTIDRPAQLVTYANGSMLKIFPLANVVSVTRYEGLVRRAYVNRHPYPGPYGYQVWTLCDGTELVLTSLLYIFTEPSVLLPPVTSHSMHPRYCWLPGDPLITWRHANTFYI